jgi:3',5'-nucleoside bisphosphate phosphatase
MKHLKADLHIHTVLSPCGDLEMSPVRIVAEAKRKGLDIIGITDHNTTRHCRLVSRLANEKGIFVMQGAEVTTKEEVHCLAFFENNDILNTFQEYLDVNLPDIMNKPEKFGYQVQVDENEIIIYEEKKLLINAISKGIDELEIFVHSLNGIFIPAHIDRKKNSIYSQLGFLPKDLKADALEISRAVSPGEFIKANPEVKKFPVIRSSDSHIIDTIGVVSTVFQVEEASFSEVCMAIRGLKGRKIIIE